MIAGQLEIMLLGMRGLGKPGVHQCKMIEWNMWAKDYPVPYTPEFVPQMPHICDALRPVDGDLPDTINMERYSLSEDQKRRAPELIELFKKLPAHPYNNQRRTFNYNQRKQQGFQKKK